MSRHEPDFDDLDDLQAEDIYSEDDEPDFMDIDSVAPGSLSSSQLDRVVGVEEDIPEEEFSPLGGDPLETFRTPAPRRDIEIVARIAEEQRLKRGESTQSGGSNGE